MLNRERLAQSGQPTARRRTYMIVAFVLVVAVVVALVLLSRPSVRYYSTTASLTAVAFPDVGHSWAVGDNYTDGGGHVGGATIRATTNGGVTWRELKSGTTWDPWAVAFANARCGWVVGEANPDINGKPLGGDVNVILATTDGGGSWKKQHSDTTYALGDVACSGPTHAWAVGGYPQNSIIMGTTDGGVDWKRQYLTTAGSLEAIAFADVRHGWAAGDGLVLATSDGGATWKQQGSVTHYDLTRVSCASATHAWAMGLDNLNNHDVILATTDGGTTWKMQYSRAGVNSLSGIVFADTTHGWVVGSGGVILATTDGGTSWRPQHSGTKTDLLDVAFADAKHGLVVGNRFKGHDPMENKFIGSIILRTTDGGATWQH